jgi:uncharacterized membrane protein YkgB
VREKEILGACFRIKAVLLLDLVGAAEHVVNVGEVIGTWEEAIGLAGGGIALLKVGVLTEVAHLDKR